MNNALSYSIGGTVLEARLKAEGEYEIFRTQQDAEYISDFDREIKRLEGNNDKPQGTRKKTP